MPLSWGWILYNFLYDLALNTIHDATRALVHRRVAASVLKVCLLLLLRSLVPCIACCAPPTCYDLLAGGDEARNHPCWLLGGGCGRCGQAGGQELVTFRIPGRHSLVKHVTLDEGTCRFLVARIYGLHYVSVIFDDGLHARLERIDKVGRFLLPISRARAHPPAQ